MNAHTLSQNHLLDQRYRIIRTLGNGATGQVYLAHHVHLDVPVALKCLTMARTVPPSQREKLINRFIQEARLLTTLRHPSIPRVLDYFTEDGACYLVMDYIEGHTLAAHLRHYGPLSPDQAIICALSLLDSLSYLHQQSPPIVYRDLKPSNVMLAPDGRVFLLDFGIALRLAADLPDPTAGAGSPGYAAPEQYSNNAIDTRADLFSLGVLLHELVTGRQPPPLPIAFPPAEQLNAQVPHRLSALIEHALQLAPADRFQNAAEFRQALLGCQAELSVSKMGESEPTRAVSVAPDPKRSAKIASAVRPGKRGLLAAAGSLLMTMTALVGLVVAIILAPPQANTHTNLEHNGQAAPAHPIVNQQRPATPATAPDNGSTTLSMPITTPAARSTPIAQLEHPPHHVALPHHHQRRLPPNVRHPHGHGLLPRAPQLPRGPGHHQRAPARPSPPKPQRQTVGNPTPIVWPYQVHLLPTPRSLS